MYGIQMYAQKITKQVFGEQISKPNITDERRANCSQTTGKRLASSVARHGLVRLALT